MLPLKEGNLVRCHTPNEGDEYPYIPMRQVWPKPGRENPQRKVWKAGKVKLLPARYSPVQISCAGENHCG
ncbi:hypothetical protein D3C87_2105220 [compost metagenome]